MKMQRDRGLKNKTSQEYNLIDGLMNDVIYYQNEEKIYSPHTGQIK